MLQPSSGQHQVVLLFYQKHSSLPGSLLKPREVQCTPVAQSNHRVPAGARWLYWSQIRPVKMKRQGVNMCTYTSKYTLLLCACVSRRRVFLKHLGLQRDLTRPKSQTPTPTREHWGMLIWLSQPCSVHLGGCQAPVRTEGEAEVPATLHLPLNSSLDKLSNKEEPVFIQNRRKAPFRVPVFASCLKVS